MIERIRYRLLMRRLQKEIALVVNGKQHAQRHDKMKTAAVTTCKACGSIV